LFGFPVRQCLCAGRQPLGSLATIEVLHTDVGQVMSTDEVLAELDRENLTAGLREARPNMKAAAGLLLGSSCPGRAYNQAVSGRLLTFSFLVALGVAVAAQAPMRTVWDGVYTQEQAETGCGIYAEACASCHGDTLGGIEAAPALSGPSFEANWTGTTLNDLAERIRVSMPADDPGSFSRRQVADVVAYMLSVGGFPAGDFVLDRQATVLQRIQYLGNRPE
jgi:mono/diheme cytochrome c family protein